MEDEEVSEGSLGFGMSGLPSSLSGKRDPAGFRCNPGPKALLKIAAAAGAAGSTGSHHIMSTFTICQLQGERRVFAQADARAAWLH